jgi:hypothetical protein
VKIEQDGHKEKSLIIKPGKTEKVKLAKGTARVNGVSGVMQAIDIVAIKGRQTAKLTTPGGKPLSANQLASNTESCPLVVDGVAYSYACGGNGTILRHNAGALGSTANATLFSGQSFISLTPYKKGLLGVQTSGGGALVYLELPTAKVFPVALPGDIQTALANNPPRIVTASTEGVNRFVLAFPRGKTYLLKDTGDIKPVELQIGDKDRKLDDQRLLINPSFFGSQLIVYAGSGYDTHDGNEGTTANHKTAPLPGHIYEYDDAGKAVKTVNLPNGTSADDVTKLSDKYYLSTLPSAVDFYYLEGDNLRHIYNLAETGSWAVQKDKTYIQVKGLLYEFMPTQDGLFGLHSVFASTTVTVSEIYSSSIGVLFTGSSTGDGTTTTRLYQLTDQPAPINAEDKTTPPAVRGEPNYQGLDPFIEGGVSADQVENLKVAMSKYISGTGKAVTRALVDNVDVVPRNRNSTSDTDIVNFTLKLDNDTPLKAKLEYTGRKAVRLYLTDPANGKQLFDSGNIGS